VKPLIRHYTGFKLTAEGEESSELIVHCRGVAKPSVAESALVISAPETDVNPNTSARRQARQARTLGVVLVCCVMA